MIMIKFLLKKKPKKTSRLFNPRSASSMSQPPPAANITSMLRILWKSDKWDFAKAPRGLADRTKTTG